MEVGVLPAAVAGTGGVVSNVPSDWISWQISLPTDKGETLIDSL